MIYIKKQAEPRALTKYKKDPHAYFDGFDKKLLIRRSLYEEQGHLCAYCMRKIKSAEDVKIEHYIAQSPADKASYKSKDALDYKNMLGVCDGNEKSKTGTKVKKSDTTCDVHRKNIRLMVNPLDKEHINRISYSADGKITSSSDDIKKDLEETLNLNCKNLIANRKSALDILKQHLLRIKPAGTWEKEFLSKQRERLCALDANGSKLEFVGILLWYIDNKIK